MYIGANMNFGDIFHIFFIREGKPDQYCIIQLIFQRFNVSLGLTKISIVCVYECPREREEYQIKNKLELDHVGKTFKIARSTEQDSERGVIWAVELRWILGGSPHWLHRLRG